MFHFQTTKYSAHKASDKYLEQFSNNMDRFVEVMQGIYGKVRNDTMILQPFNFSDYKTLPQMTNKMNEFINILKQFDNYIGNNTSLANIRDEMLADAQQFVYLLKFE